MTRHNVHIIYTLINAGVWKKKSFGLSGTNNQVNWQETDGLSNKTWAKQGSLTICSQALVVRICFFSSYKEKKAYEKSPKRNEKWLIKEIIGVEPLIIMFVIDPFPEKLVKACPRHGDRLFTYHIHDLQEAQAELNRDGMRVVSNGSFHWAVVPQKVVVQPALVWPLKSIFTRQRTVKALFLHQQRDNSH